MSQNYLVTGGAGFIGSHLCEALLSKGHRVTVLDNFRTGNKLNLKGLDVRLIEGDIRDLYTVESLVAEADVVFHLAAMVSSAESFNMLRDCISINTLGTVNILESAKSSGRGKVVFSSSGLVANDPNSQHCGRMASATPISVTKRDAESYMCIYQEQWGVPTTTLRYDQVFGPRQNHHSCSNGIVPNFIIKALKNQPIEIHGDGSQTRDFIYVKDVVKANLIASQSGNEIYNIVSGEQVSLLELAVIIKSLTHSSSTIQLLEQDVNHIQPPLNSSDNLDDLGFKPEYSLTEALKETISYCENLLSGDQVRQVVKVA